MKNNIVYFVVLVLVVSICSCNKNGGNSNDKEEKKDTLYNDNIQSTFFDAPFGSSKKDVIAKFEEHGFIVNKYTSTDALVHFQPSTGSRFTFGNMPWEMLDASFINDKFYHIRFMNASDDKASAIQIYENVLSNLSAKYKMTNEEPSDTTCYRVSVGYSKQKRIVFVACYRYETTSHTIMQGISLEYQDGSFANEVSDEL